MRAGSDMAWDDFVDDALVSTLATPDLSPTVGGRHTPPGPEVTSPLCSHSALDAERQTSVSCDCCRIPKAT